MNNAKTIETIKKVFRRQAREKMLAHLEDNGHPEPSEEVIEWCINYAANEIHSKGKEDWERLGIVAAIAYMNDPEEMFERAIQKGYIIPINPH
jgi:hypothetical protein